MVSEQQRLDPRYQRLVLSFLLRPHVHTPRPDAVVVRIRMMTCDLCASDKAHFVLESTNLDGPLVKCSSCGLYYVGSRRSRLTFGADSPEQVVDRVRQANVGF